MRLEHFTCPEQGRDAITVASIIAYALFMCMCLFWALLGKVKGHYGQGVLMLLYAAVQLFLLAAPVALLYNTPTAPLPSAIALMMVLVCMLKLHSYLATNFAMEAEHVVATSDSDNGLGREPIRKAQGAMAKNAATTATNHSLDSKTVATSAPLAVPDELSPIVGNSRKARARRRKRRAALEQATAAKDSNSADQRPLAGPEFMQSADVMTVTDAATGQTHEIALSDAEQTEQPAAGGAADETAPDQLLPYSSASVDGSEITPHPRQESRQRRLKEARQWPANVTVGNFAYFLAAPTLVYEPSYPRTRRIRRRYITARLIEMLACSTLRDASVAAAPHRPLSVCSPCAVLPHGAVHAACFCGAGLQGLVAGSAEAFNPQHGAVAADVLHTVPLLLEHRGRAHHVRRPSVLPQVVQRHNAEALLGRLEPAGA